MNEEKKTFKKWFEEKKEKGEMWIEKNKGAIGFGLGLVTMAGVYMLAEKLDKPKSGSISFTRRLEDADSNVLVGVYYKNRFGREKNPLNILYKNGSDSKTLKELCDNLSEIVYPGD